MLADLLPQFAFLAGVALYGVVVWHALRRHHILALAVGSAATAIALGYVQVGRHCNRGLTCDVGGVDYVAVLWPRFTLLFALALGGAPASVALLTRRRPSLSWRQPLASMIAAVMAIVVGAPAMSAVNDYFVRHHERTVCTSTTAVGDTTSVRCARR